MSEVLDMIPIEFWRKHKDEDWVKSPVQYLLDAEYADEDIVNLNLIGYTKEYQVQFKISKFLELLEARGISLQTSEKTQDVGDKT